MDDATCNPRTIGAGLALITDTFDTRYVQHIIKVLAIGAIIPWSNRSEAAVIPFKHMLNMWADELGKDSCLRTTIHTHRSGIRVG